MTELEVTVAQLVALNGGEIVGKTRLQKIMYLLEEKRLGFDLEFDYHNFGPFSMELAYAVDDAVFLKLLSEKQKHGYHEVPYVVYRSTDKVPPRTKDSLTKKRRQALGIMNDYSALELEVAATAVYLRENGYRNNFIDELKIRKPKKATRRRIERALKLIEDLGL